ncbi:hypothetical protein GCM10023075_31890 [Streptosporangium album]|uniref:hypothetical protein n=1 Tax=Streptosporangium album TaxID=47479 RepID=UPI00337105BB
MRHLNLLDLDFEGSLAFLDSLPRLDSLLLRGVTSVRDFGPVARHTGLSNLTLHGARHLRDTAIFASLPNLVSVCLRGADIQEGLATLAENCRGLRELRLQETAVSDLGPLAGLPGLRKGRARVVTGSGNRCPVGAVRASARYGGSQSPPAGALWLAAIQTSIRSQWS